MSDDAIHAEVQPEKQKESDALRLAKLVLWRKMANYIQAELDEHGEDVDAEAVQAGLLEILSGPAPTSAELRAEAHRLEEELRHRNLDGLG